MQTAILMSLILSTTSAAVALAIFGGHARELQARREQALLACKHTRMRQELVKYVSDHRQLSMRVR